MTSQEARDPGLLVTCKNWDFTRPGLMVKRRGIANWGTAASQNVQRLLFLDSVTGEGKYAIVLTSSGAYYSDVTGGSPSTWTLCDGTSGKEFVATHAYERAAFVNWKQNLFALCTESGGDATLKMFTDQAKYRDPYLAAPTSAPTVATGAAGDLTGDYYYKVCFRSTRRSEAADYTIISNPSPASSLVQPSSQKVNLTNIPVSSDPDATNKYIYRTKAGGSVYYYVTSITNATTSYTDNTTDDNLGAALHDEDHTTLTDLISAPYYAIEGHRDRLFVATGKTIAFTEPDEPYYWGYSSDSGRTTNTMTLPMVEGEEIRSMASINGVLIIATSRSLWELVGYYRDTWELHQVANVGCIAPMSFAKTPYGLIFASDTGVHLYDGERLTEISLPIRNRLEGQMHSYARGVWHYDRYLFATGSAGTFAYFPGTKAWTEYTTTGWPTHQWVHSVLYSSYFPQALIAVDNTSGQLVELLKDGTYADLGNAYTAQATTGVLPIAPMQQKSFKRIYLTAEAGGSSTIEVKISLDDGTVTDTSSFTTSSSVDRYAEALPAGIVGEEASIDIQHKLSTGSEIAISEVGLDYRIRGAGRR